MSKGSIRVDIERMIDILESIKDDGYAVATLHIAKDEDNQETVYISATDIETNDSISYGALADEEYTLNASDDYNESYDETFDDVFGSYTDEIGW